MSLPEHSDTDRLHHSALFVATWALYVLIHIYKLTPWGEQVTVPLQIINWMLIACALFVIFRPTNVWLFLTLCVLQVSSFLVQLPGMANCWMFSSLIAIGILASFVQTLFRHRISKIRITHIYDNIAPMIRWSLIALYTFVVVAKCNWAFFDIQTSCASYFCELICLTYGLENPPDWLLWSSIPGTLVIEAAIPILLCFRSSRAWGLVTGLAFHTFIAHSYKILVFDFSALLLPLYLTFTTPRLIAVLQTSRMARVGRWAAANRRILLVSTLLMSLLVIWSVTHRPGFMSVTLYRFRGALWMFIGLFLTAFAFHEFVLNRQNVFDLEKPFRICSWPTAIALLLIVANGLSPYLGLKTGVAYTMFSNLRTESGYENHVFIPAQAKVFSYQDQSVLVLASSEPKLQRLADANERLLLHDLRLRAAKFPGASLTYEFDGVVNSAARVDIDPIVGQPLTVLEHKLLFFRSIPLYNHRHQW